MASERVTLTVSDPDGEREVDLSSPNKMIWPEAGSGGGITKAELAEYVQIVADPFLNRERASARFARALPQRRDTGLRELLLEEPAQGHAPNSWMP